MIKYLLAPLFLLAAFVMLIMPRKHNELGFVKDGDEHAPAEKATAWGRYLDAVNAPDDHERCEW